MRYAGSLTVLGTMQFCCLENAVLVPNSDWDSVGLWVDRKIRSMFHGTFYIRYAPTTSSFKRFDISDKC